MFQGGSPAVEAYRLTMEQLSAPCVATGEINAHEFADVQQSLLCDASVSPYVSLGPAGRQYRVGGVRRGDCGQVFAI